MGARSRLGTKNGHGWGLLIILGLTACSENEAPPVPHLISLEVVTPEGQLFDLVEPADAGVQAFSPLSKLRATFSALLDPAKVQDLSGPSPLPGQGVAALSWQKASGPVEVPLLATYNPARTQSGLPAPVVGFSPQGALPADATLTIRLDPQRLVNKNGVPFVGVREASFQTQPFMATVTIPERPLGTDFSPRISFNSVPAAFTSGAISVTDALGQPVAIELLPDPAQAAGYLVSPLGEGVPWQPGTYTLLLDGARLTDTFGVPLAPGARDWPFTIAATGGSAGDAGTD